jgi:hypothetical protein
MPNWVFNGLTVEGSPEQVDKLIKQMNTPFVDSIKANGDLAFSIEERKYSNPIFSFRNIIAPTDLDAYHLQPDFSSDKPYSGNDWYSFNNREWGTKWDVAVPDENNYTDTTIQEEMNGENKVVYYTFDTAWAPPTPAIEKLSEQYPDLLMTLNYREEGGWGGEVEYLKGEMISESEYNNKCEECDYEYEDDEIVDECEDCYTVCPKCGFSYNLCETHQEEYNNKSVLPPKVEVK